MTADCLNGDASSAVRHEWLEARIRRSVRASPTPAIRYRTM